MYREFYGLEQKPFSILPDPNYLYWGHSHSLAYSMLEYGVMNRAGFTVVTGEIGCGKTTLIRHLLDRLDEEFTVGLVSNIQDGDLLQWVLMAFGQTYEGKSHVGLHDELQQFLIREYAEGRRTILIVDEAQNLGPKLLEQLRLLSNINADNDQLLQLILVGQPQLKGLLQAPELTQFAQRIASDFHLAPLTAEDIDAYIKHRLSIAGRDLPLFTMDACEALFEASRGIPRIINILADTCLVYGFARMAPEIDGGIVEEVIRDKRTHGIFDVGAPKGAEDTRRLPVQSREEVEEEKPALVIHDKELAKLIVKKLQNLG
ncbi:AAA family ATPase [Sneathiella sp. CAU 1612]|uniref:AAA family ATPase n=1 Tax=Sneathiella sedimenti TaxID=2816034 RepID=A0ABS3F2B9_9PROT|nr:AAA family ATPase [Sneathiella sedimenti]MBO0332660.1 AAA family ATPase [Sneathiella sedimenti]